jgi:hypothetical protein
MPRLIKNIPMLHYNYGVLSNVCGLTHTSVLGLGTPFFYLGLGTQFSALVLGLHSSVWVSGFHFPV